MNEMECMQKLLEEMSVILKSYDEKRHSNSSDFNILQVLGVGSKEVPVCRLICELLNPHGLYDDLERMVAERVPTYTGQKTDVFYLWKYLPIDKIDFRGCNEEYMKLYDAKSYGEMIGKMCDEILSFLSEWECAK